MIEKRFLKRIEYKRAVFTLGTLISSMAFLGKGIASPVTLTVNTNTRLPNL